MNRVDEEAPCKRLNVSITSQQFDQVEREANRRCAGNKSYLLREILADWMKQNAGKK